MSAQKRTSRPEPPSQPELTVPWEEAAEKIRNRIRIGSELQNLPANSPAELENGIKEMEKWQAYNKDLLNSIFTIPKLAEEYSFQSIGQVRISLGGPRSIGETFRSNMDQLKRRIQILESIIERLELFPLAQGVAPIPPEPKEKRELGNKVFVVHGDDEEAKQSVARLLEKLELEPIILHEKAIEGRTIIEKLEHYSDVDFAVILLTPDDVGAEKEKASELKPRARQNVILELGYFIGKLTRKRVCPLYRGSVDLPSDYIGAGYIQMDDPGAWRYELAKELKAGGFSVDVNKLI